MFSFNLLYDKILKEKFYEFILLLYIKIFFKVLVVTLILWLFYFYIKFLIVGGFYDFKI